ncbi:hypothetical protein [Methylobacterium haplocladii]|uniref:Uncharacterized protein n=1 Tax=Methylobacterium haplocladii TaxID=1176176 RepID=A0A512ISF9_9HYPH|nr:hypothetical protein [Methylobacterium haplocladii]GEP00621.1 hypothetical protein MHA02_30080 [Methylobacterium haplocladii]GJD85536.1 hypothetical protein HPGCJGGD_3425 [Methylobacterium haplocladii]GLS57769.1 hypothetical protein GCM10007887_04250 [Methylobacterium haplocladii]
MTNILAIQPRYQPLRVALNDDWTDSFPLYQAGTAGVVVGSGNTGNGSVSVQSVEPRTPLGGHAVVVTSTDNLVGITVTDPNGAVTALGYAGAPLSAGGLVLTVTPGSTPFRVGDAFAVQPTPATINDTGISYVLQVRRADTIQRLIFEALSDPTDNSDPLIVKGNGTGAPGLMVPYTTMGSGRLLPGDYVYELLAFGDDRRKVAYYGPLTFVEAVVYLL